MANANDTGLLILAGIAALGLAFRPRGAGAAVGGTGSRPRSPKTAARLQPAAPALDDTAVLAGGPTAQTPKLGPTTVTSNVDRPGAAESAVPAVVPATIDPFTDQVDIFAGIDDLAFGELLVASPPVGGFDDDDDTVEIVEPPIIDPFAGIDDLGFDEALDDQSYDESDDFDVYDPYSDDAGFGETLTAAEFGDDTPATGGASIADVDVFAGIDDLGFGEELVSAAAVEVPSASYAPPDRDDTFFDE